MANANRKVIEDPYDMKHLLLEALPELTTEDFKVLNEMRKERELPLYPYRNKEGFVCFLTQGTDISVQKFFLMPLEEMALYCTEENKNYTELYSKWRLKIGK